MPTEPSDTDRPTNFIRQIVERDLESGATGGRVVTRFPPEPNGYPHIGHAKAICLNFDLARDYDGTCHLRFDDTNPETEDMEYVRAMKRDIRWLGYDWGEHEYYASDYFEKLYDLAVRLIRDGQAFVDSDSTEEIRRKRGTVTEPGTPSPHRDRSVDENLDLFRRMRDGEFGEGEHVLRAKVDMASPNMLMRDPVLYRIRHAEHYRRGNDWCIYPLYDFAHPLSDAIEGITHSLCTLEFDVHRPIYDWLVDALFDEPRPHQYESARLNLDYTIMSKRKLLRLVKEGHVAGWDDPRMPTISGMRRRGYTPESIRRFCTMIGVAKADNRVDLSMLEYAVRDDLNHRAPRVMAVLDPLRVVLTNWPEDRIEWLDAPYWPHDVPNEGSRKVPFGRTLWIERDDFMDDPPKRFHRLSPGAEVRLRYGYVIRCDEVVRGDDGTITELRCSVDLDTRGGDTGGRRVKGTIHWVEVTHAVSVPVRLYDRLFSVPNPEDVAEDASFIDHLNPHSLETVPSAMAEHSLRDAKGGERYQFERQGYFFVDPEDSEEGRPVFNRTVTLRDSWAKIAGDGAPAPAASEPAPVDSVPAGPPVPDMTGKQEARARELAARYGIAFEDAAILATEPPLREFFEAAASGSDHAKSISNWVVHELQRERKETPLADLAIRPEHLAELVDLVEDGTLSSRLAKEVFADILTSGKRPSEVVEERGLVQIDDEDRLRRAAEAVVDEFPDRAEAYRGGKTGLMGFFIGQVMKRTDGKANPQVTRRVLEEALVR